MRILVFAAALMAATLGMAADAPQSSDLDRLNVFAGTWKSEAENYDTIFSKAGIVSSTLVNQCWKAGAFFVCNQSVNGVSRVLLAFGYKGGDTYFVNYVPADTGRAVSGTVIIAGGVWTYPGQQTKLGQTTYFRTVDIFNDNDNIDFREEFSTDNQNWTLMSKGHETRVR
ncbi:MAG TPA: hypothetical protein VGT99_12450 [Gammaproteobacteria bacterium]|nr:hypothetical protein [Gammaproteobacteria bacterium]